MKVEHIAIWSKDIEVLKQYYEKYFEASSNEKYRNFKKDFSSFVDLQAKYDWVLDVLLYDNVDNLIKVLEPAILVPALEKSAELMTRKAQAIKKRDIADYL